jgi:ATP-dependent DNA helicase RecG
VGDIVALSKSSRITSLAEEPVTRLAGVGPERSAQLAKLGVHTVEELLLHRPRRYEDRRNFSLLAGLRLDGPSLVRGKVVACGINYFRQRSKSMVQVILDDGTARLHLRWWNQPFMARLFEVGDEVVVFGKPRNLKPRTMDHPETEVVETGEEDWVHLNRVVPIYPLTEGLSQRWLRGLIWRTLSSHGARVQAVWPELERAAVNGTLRCGRSGLRTPA